MIDIALDLVPREMHAPPSGRRRSRRPAPGEVAIVGRPNVGKSTLVNALLGEERVIAFDEPGTTRDAIRLDFERGDRRYTLIDTAGIRRRGKVFEAVEKFSVIKTLQAIEDANVVVLVLDAEGGITEQDAHLAGHILESGRALVVAVNKWDAVPTERRDDVKRDLDRKMGFLSFAQQHFISAREARGLPALFASVDAGVRRRDGQAADAAPDADAAAGGGAAGAPARRIGATEVALRPPRGRQSAAGGHPRLGARPRARRLSALPGTFFCRGVPTAGNAA